MYIVLSMSIHKSFQTSSGSIGQYYVCKLKPQKTTEYKCLYEHGRDKERLSQIISFLRLHANTKYIVHMMLYTYHTVLYYTACTPCVGVT